MYTCAESFARREKGLIGVENTDRYMGPLMQLENLSCYCDADRLVVAKIEANLRQLQIHEFAFVAGLQFVLGKKTLREPIGTIRQ